MKEPKFGSLEFEWHQLKEKARRLWDEHRRQESVLATQQADSMMLRVFAEREKGGRK